MALHAPDGSINITVLSSPSQYTGLFAADGSMNVVASSGGYVGAAHPCGAAWVTNNTSNNTFSIRAPDGSSNISVSPYFTGTQRCTIVSGSFGPSTPGAIFPIIIP